MTLSKDQIANDHLAWCEEQYGMLTHRPSGERRAVVIGARPGNIGGYIASELDIMGHYEDVQKLDFHDDHFDASNRGDLAMKAWADFDTLVLANGFTDLAWLEEQQPENIARMVNSNLTASMMATNKFVRETLGDPWIKYIVFIGSMAHRSVLNASAYYCAAKAGLAHFARCAGWELTPKGYRVFCVHPSNTEGTPMTEATIEGIRKYRGLSRDEAEDYWGAVNLMPGWLQPGDIGQLVHLLVSGSMDYLTGTQIELSGGQR